MNVQTPSYVKTNMAKVLDAAISGKPTIVTRKGRLAIIKEYDPYSDSLSRLEGAFEKAGGLEKEPTAEEQELVLEVSRRGRRR